VDFLFLIVPAIIYGVPASILKFLFFRSGKSYIAAAVVYVLPFFAWVLSIFLRNTGSTGMGNFIYEPLLVAVVPSLFHFAQARFQETFRRIGSEQFVDLGLVFVLSVLVFIVGSQMPAIGDWP
jgi:hypothetical protein